MPDFYKMGMDCDEENNYKRPPRDRVGDFFYTPAEIIAEGNTVQAAIVMLDRDIAGAQVRLVFQENWETFKAEWKAFFDVRKSLAGQLMPFGAMDKTKEFRARVETWRDAFKKEGGKPTTPGPEETPGGINWKYVLIGGGVLAALFVGATVVREVGGTVRAFKE